VNDVIAQTPPVEIIKYIPINNNKEEIDNNVEQIVHRPIIETISNSPIQIGPNNLINMSTSSEVGTITNEELENLKKKHLKIIENLQQNHE
jgi:hypothetical protein